MDKSRDYQNRIKFLIKKIAEKYQPEKIILFGSLAWGKQKDDSDVDLFIIKDTPKRRIDRAREVREIIWGSGLPVDILVYTPQEVKRRLAMRDFFIQDIIRKGKILYSQ